MLLWMKLILKVACDIVCKNNYFLFITHIPHFDYTIIYGRLSFDSGVGARFPVCCTHALPLNCYCNMSTCGHWMLLVR